MLFLAVCFIDLGIHESFMGGNGPNKLMCYPQQLGRFWKVCGYLPRNSPESYQSSAPEPSGTSSATCTRILHNLISHLHQIPLEHLHPNNSEPHPPSALEPAGT